MNILPVEAPQARARALEFEPHTLVVHLYDGRSLSVPLEWFPRLRDASLDQLGRYEFSGGGLGLHWPELDEDLSVPGLLGLPD
jgi:hypothetical protein